MTRNIIRFSAVFVYTITILLTLMSTNVYARIRPVKTSCPACYHLASEHNATLRQHRELMREINKLRREIEFMRGHNKQISPIEVEAEKKLQAVQAQAANLVPIMDELQKRIGACEAKHCQDKLRFY